jgi:hypothetical protein
MVKHFSENGERANRAVQTWLILVGAAHDRQTITYKRLANMIGYRSGIIITQILGHILYYCQDNDLPLLTVLVVNEKTGIPGFDYDDPDARREEVFAHKWYDDWPPSAKELAKIYAKHPKN